MSVGQSGCVSYFVRVAVAAALGAAMMAPTGQVLAAEDGPGAANSAAPELEEITVTGSRIRRPELEATSPLVSVSSEQLETRSGLNIESYLNQLPNFNPATTPTTGNTDIQSTAVNSVGISTISLRGFGANRSLVLVDGHRTTPVNPLMVTDVNSIPTAMIDRVEIITGGASAVYGADAIGGVTNFILKKNFQGLQVDVQDGITAAGDGNELRVTTLMGTKIADGRGNIMMGAEYYDRNGAFQRNRSFYTDGWNDPNIGTQYLYLFGTNGINTVATPPSKAAVGALFPGRGVLANGTPMVLPGAGTNASLRFNSDGTVWDPAGPIGTSNYIGPQTGNGFALFNQYDTTGANSAASPPNVIQALKWSNPNETVSEPQTRYSFYANGIFDLTDKVQFYTNARFTQSNTSTYFFPTSANLGREATIPYNATTDSPVNPALVNNTTSQAALSALAASFTANPTSSNPNWNPGFIPTNTKGAQHPVPWQLALLLNSRGPIAANASVANGGPVGCNPAIPAAYCTSAPASWTSETFPLNSIGSRSTVDTTTEWTVETGLKFPIVADWTGDVYYARGQSTAYTLASGYESVQRWRAVADAPDYGRNLSLIGNQNSASPGFGTTVPTTCTSGLYNTFFAADQAPSADCSYAVQAVPQAQTQLQQDVVEANFQGSLFRLPAGEISAAAGYQFRRDSAQYIPDQLQSANSFLDSVMGVFPTGGLNAQTTVKDYYAELFVPVISDLGIIRKASLDFGGRYSDYSATASTTTFKIDADVQLGSSFRLRGGFNRATRAPNLGELFLGEQELVTTTGNAYGDPCSVRSIAPFGAGGAAADTSPSAGAATAIAPGQTAAGAQSTYLICQALMGTTGANAYYHNSNQSTTAASTQFYVNQEGNPNLESEKAKTWTGGVVLSRLSDNALLRDFSASIDWWRIDIRNAIGLDNTDYANFQCYGGAPVTDAAGAAARAASTACQSVNRDLGTGLQNSALLVYTNQGTISTSGIDLQLNWMARFDDMGIKHIPGALTFSSQDSFLNFYKTKQSPANFDVVTDWKGTLGPTLTGTNPGAYSYRLFTSIGWMMPRFNVDLRWRFLPSVEPAAVATQKAIIKNNASVSAGSGGQLLGYTPTTVLSVPAWSAFDLSFNWNINKVLQLRGGVNNLFNKEPAITGASAGYPVGTNLAGVCSGYGAGCRNPASYSLPVSGQGTTSAGFYDVYGRAYFLGVKASF
ncbi:MAG TPA: TonB-dependent receptor [Steroidobacteraceae bacterium]|jgi:outer membrane receptor protein involved in Fe transport